MALLNHLGEEVTPEDITETHFKNGNAKRIIAASDMDGTMFKNDLGPLIFLEKLSDPNFWELDIPEFSNILLPKKYRQLLQEGAEWKIKELRPEICRLALDLIEDIRNLYGHIQELVTADGHWNGEQKLIREFARKMMELDRIFVMVDSILSQKLNGEILMRTRFFAGKHPHAISHLTKRVMHRSKIAVDRHIPLPIDPDHAHIAGQQVSEEMICEVHNENESPFKRVDRYVQTVHDVLDFVQHAIVEAGIIGIVATGNLQAIAKTALMESEYKFMEDQPFRRKKQHTDRPPLVVGTWLRAAEDGTLHPRVQGKPVLGARKAFEVNQFARDRNKKLGIALGDSPGTDGPMIISSLNQEGIAVIVGQDVDAIRNKFKEVFDRMQKHHQRKVYYSVERS